MSKGIQKCDFCLVDLYYLSAHIKATLLSELG